MLQICENILQILLKHQINNRFFGVEHCSKGFIVYKTIAAEIQINSNAFVEKWPSTFNCALILWNNTDQNVIRTLVDLALFAAVPVWSHIHDFALATYFDQPFICLNL